MHKFLNLRLLSTYVCEKDKLDYLCEIKQALRLVPVKFIIHLCDFRQDFKLAEQNIFLWYYNLVLMRLYTYTYDEIISNTALFDDKSRWELNLMPEPCLHLLFSLLFYTFASVCYLSQQKKLNFLCLKYDIISFYNIRPHLS